MTDVSKLPDTGALVSDPQHVQLHDSHFVRLPSGVDITRLPVWDGEHQLFARLGWQAADEWCVAHSPSPRPEALVLVLGGIYGWWRAGQPMIQPLSMFHAGQPGHTDYATTVHVVLVDGYYRLPTCSELDELHAMALHIEPVCKVFAEADTLHMSSHRWCAEHDGKVAVRLDDAAMMRLAESGYSGQPVANAGKHWVCRLLDGAQDAPDGTGDTEPAPESGSAPDPDLWRAVLHLGMVGWDVAEWQAVIGARTDGDFGPETDSLTRSWQRERELTADGIVGPATRAAIGSPPVPVPDPYEDPPLVEVVSPDWLDELELLRARNYTPGPRTVVDWIVPHSSENPPINTHGTVDTSDDTIRPWVALGVGRWFAGQDWRGRDVRAPRASSHYVVGGDPDPAHGVVWCLPEDDVAWTAGRRAVNNRAVQVEIIGQAMTTDWSSPIMRPTLERFAAVSARSCHRWSAPVREVSTAELREARQRLEAGETVLPEHCRGFISHWDVTEVWEVIGGHADPGGPGDRRWPWELVLDLVRSRM